MALAPVFIEETLKSCKRWSFSSPKPNLSGSNGHWATGTELYRVFCWFCSGLPRPSGAMGSVVSGDLPRRSDGRGHRFQSDQATSRSLGTPSDALLATAGLFHLRNQLKHPVRSKISSLSPKRNVWRATVMFLLLERSSMTKLFKYLGNFSQQRAHVQLPEWEAHRMMDF